MEEERNVFAKDFVVEKVLEYMDTEALFTCAEVNRQWQSLALSVLRRKLVSVSVCCAPESGKEENELQSCLGGVQVCMEIFCSRFARFRNIARMAGMRPSLVILCHHGDLSEDKRVVEYVLDLLPVDSVIVYFKLELILPDDDSEVSTHEGIFGEFLFRPDTGPFVPAPVALQGRPEDQQPTATSLSGPPQQQPQPRDELSAFPAPISAAGSPVAGARHMAPPVATPPVQSRPRAGSSAGSEAGMVFRNVLPGVLVFQALHVTEAILEGNAVTSFFTEADTQRTIQVTSAAVFSRMHGDRLQLFMRRLSASLGSTENTVAIAFPRNQDETLPELAAFERNFPRVPVLANRATQFDVDGQYAPLSRIRLVLLLIKLLE